MKDIKTVDSKSCKEIYIILNKLGLFYKLPEEIKKYISDNQSETYEYDFNIDLPLIYQIDNDVTKAYLSYLYLKYINNSAEEKQILLKKYEQNEKIYQEKLYKQYSIDEIFKRKSSIQKNTENEYKEKQMIVYDNTIVKKIMDFIKKIIYKFKR